MDAISRFRKMTGDTDCKRDESDERHRSILFCKVFLTFKKAYSGFVFNHALEA